MFVLRIKQIETALAAGRLDEACQLLAEPDMRAHRRGQALVTDVSRHLQQRAAQHLEAQQYEAALQDCYRALALAGNQPELEQLRARAAAALAQYQQQQAQQEELLRAAQQRLAQGELSAGQQLCGQLPEDAARRAALSAQIERQREQAAAALERARAAWSRQAVHEAVQALRQAEQLAPHQPDLLPLKGQILEQLSGQARTALEQGLLPRGESLLALASTVDPRALQVVETSGLLQRSQQAACEIERGEFAAAWETLRVLGQLLPTAAWIQEALSWADQAQQARQALRGSPLFTLRHPAAAMRAAVAATGALPHPRPAGPTAAAAIPSRFLVQVDGAGRYLTLRQPSVRLGSQRELSPVDVDWSGGDPLPPLVVERSEDDYFLRSAVPVQVNGRAVQSALLADGDRLLVGSRGAIKFLLPCAASRSAVLQFSGLRLHPPDARGVILMDDAIVIAPTAQAHIRVRELQQGFVLFHRQGQLYLRHLQASGQHEAPREVPLTQPVSLGAATLVVMPAED